VERSVAYRRRRCAAFLRSCLCVRAMQASSSLLLPDWEQLSKDGGGMESMQGPLSKYRRPLGLLRREVEDDSNPSVK
jgi:hypothetical protein